LGVGEQCFGVETLGGEHGDGSGVGAEAGAVLADVGVGAGALSRGAQAVTAGEACHDRWCVTPVIPGGAAAVGDDGDAWLAGGCWHGADAGLGQVERSFVFGAHGAVEEVRIAQTHLRGDVAEQGHQGLEMRRRR
jgi:hypothetical protein